MRTLVFGDKVFLFIVIILTTWLPIYLDEMASKNVSLPVKPKHNPRADSTDNSDTVHLDRATTYQPVVSQCDDNPFNTADGSTINSSDYQKWVALSRDLIYNEERQRLFRDTSHWRGNFRFGDTITIYSKEHPNLDGEWVVHDCMNARYKMSIDFLMKPEDNYPKLGIGTDVKIVFCENGR